jgi:GTP cyclohydrolase II
MLQAAHESSHLLRAVRRLHCSVRLWCGGGDPLTGMRCLCAKQLRVTCILRYAHNEDAGLLVSSNDEGCRRGLIVDLFNCDDDF